MSQDHNTSPLPLTGAAAVNRETVRRDPSALGAPGMAVDARAICLADLAPEGSVKPKDWIPHVIRNDETDRYLENGKDFIDDEAFRALIARMDADKAAGRSPEAARVREIIAKSRTIKGLDPEETAVLMAVEDPELLAEMEEAARWIKHKVYNNRIVTFAPLYLSSKCVNSCAYCGFRQENGHMARRRLGLDEIRRETEALTRDFGHKRLVVVYGEHPDSDIDYMVQSIDTIYSVQVQTRKGNANIRRVNVNAAPMEMAKLKRLQEVGVGTYQVFQETYDRRVYGRVHPAGTLKGNYRWRLYAMHRAMESGLDDVGTGSLFGLGDWRFEVLGLVAHNASLEKHFGGTGTHTISFPRLEPASNAPFLKDNPWYVSDRDFLRIITVLRLAVPHTGLICTARETADIRNAALDRGITQMDASTRIDLGGYSATAKSMPATGTGSQEVDEQQFLLGDNRSLEELIGDLADRGHITSFCTAGYRVGRTGDRIMRLLRDCSEGHFCKLNAILTYREWLDDFAGPAVKAKGEALIARELSEARTQMPSFMPKFEPLYEKTTHGCRDLYL